MNSDEATSRSLEMALRLQKEAPTYRDQIELGYKLAYGSKPDSREMEMLARHYQDMLDYHREKKPEPTVYPTKITRSLVEEFSGEAFEYEEFLNQYVNYTPDPLPAAMDPATRSLADICLLFFNSNRFAFVY